MCDEVVGDARRAASSSGAADALFARPAAPYTRALLAAVPRADAARPLGLATTCECRPAATNDCTMTGAHDDTAPVASSIADRAAAGARVRRRRPSAAARTASCSAWCSSRRRASTRRSAPAAAIGEVVHYNVLEGLTKINMDGSDHAAARRELDDRPRRQDLHLQAAEGRQVPRRRGLRRRATSSSASSAPRPRARPTRRRRRCSTTSAAIATPDPQTVIVVAQQRRRQLPVPHGREHRGDPRPEERADDRDQADRHRPVQVRRLGQGLGDHAGQERRLPRRRRGAS